jgi:hypothetical protein
MTLSNRQRKKLLEAGFAQVGDIIRVVTFDSSSSVVRATDLHSWNLVPTQIASDLKWDGSEKGGVGFMGFEKGTQILVKLLYVFVQTLHGIETFVASPAAKSHPVLEKLGLRRTNTFYQFGMEAGDLFARMSKQVRLGAADDEIPSAEINRL